MIFVFIKYPTWSVSFFFFFNYSYWINCQCYLFYFYSCTHSILEASEFAGKLVAVCTWIINDIAKLFCCRWFACFLNGPIPQRMSEIWGTFGGVLSICCQLIHFDRVHCYHPPPSPTPCRPTNSADVAAVTVLLRTSALPFSPFQAHRYWDLWFSFLAQMS